MSSAALFLRDINNFLKISGMSPTRFGSVTVGDPGFVANVRDGRCPRLDSYDRVMAYINRNQHKYRETIPTKRKA